MILKSYPSQQSTSEFQQTEFLYICGIVLTYINQILIYGVYIKPNKQIITRYKISNQLVLQIHWSTLFRKAISTEMCFKRRKFERADLSGMATNIRLPLALTVERWTG